MEENSPTLPTREIWNGYFRLFGRFFGTLLLPVTWPFLGLVWVFAYFTATGMIPVNDRKISNALPENSPAPGEEAEVANDLRPEGKVRCQGKLWDARSESGFLPAGTKVFVSDRGEGGRLTVRSKKKS